jgi:hypothetical protein
MVFVWAVVEMQGKMFRLGEAEYRNILCERIARKVVAAFARDGDVMVIEFDDGAIFRIALRFEDRACPEAARIELGLSQATPCRFFPDETSIGVPQYPLISTDY